MKLVAGSDLQECIKNFKWMKAYKPYEYGGKWFIAFLDGQGYAYRTIQSLKNKAGKIGIDSFDVCTIGE